MSLLICLHAGFFTTAKLGSLSLVLGVVFPIVTCVTWRHAVVLFRDTGCVARVAFNHLIILIALNARVLVIGSVSSAVEPLLSASALPFASICCLVIASAWRTLVVPLGGLLVAWGVTFMNGTKLMWSFTLAAAATGRPFLVGLADMV